jgi:hypothetical protein
MSQEEERKERKEKMVSIFLQLGDVFKITNSTNDLYNNQSYYIEYINSHKIKTIHVETLDRVEFHITPELLLGYIRLTTKKTEKDTIIDGNIDLLFRNHYEGFALQNQLLKETWIQIIFEKGELIGEIVKVEEDMIEIELFNTKEKIYINFNYNGIPEDLSIKHIKIIDKPDYDVLEHEEENLEIETIGEVEDVVQLLDIDVSRYRYDIEVQKNDLLNSMLSHLSSSEKTFENLNNIHLNIERFQQLRKQFSTFDEYGNIIDSIYKGHQWKPLINNLTTLKHPLLWILPVTSTIKKVYGVQEEGLEEFTFISNQSLDIDEKLEEIIQLFKSDVSNQKSFRYIQYLQQLYNFFTPFENLDELRPLTTIPIQNNTNVIIDNYGNFNSNIIKTVPLPKGQIYNKVENSQYIRDVYLSSDTILDAHQLTEGKMFANRIHVPYTDNMLKITGLLTLPEAIVDYSRVKLPGTNILDKTNLSHLFMNFSDILNQGTKITQYDINNENINTQINNLVDKTHLKYYKPKTSGNYLNFLENIIPSSKIIFNSVKPYIIGKLSLVNIINFLEPYLIYPDDVTFTFYSKNLVPFIENKIREFGVEIMSKKNAFDGLFNTIARLNEKHSKNTLKLTMTFPKQELCEMYEIAQINRHPYDDELLFKMTISDFKYTYTYGIVQSNIKLLIDSKMNEFIEKHEEIEKENPCEELKEECISREKCMENEKDDNNCDSISNIAENITKHNLNKVLSEFDKDFIVTERQLEEYVEQEYKYYYSILQKVIQIEYNATYGKYEKLKYKLGEEASREMRFDKEINLSPYTQLRDIILGISDIVTRYDKIIQFKEKYTYHVLDKNHVLDKTNVDHYWLFCIKTNTKLLPLFIYELAYTFINDRDKYQNKLDYIIQTQGENGDDGESYVDKYSGYVIQKKLLDSAEGYENGFKVVSREYLEEEEVEQETIKLNETIVKDRPYMKYEKYKLIIKTIDDLSSYLNHIHLDNETKNDFIANVVYQQMNTFPSEKKYREVAKRNKEKNPNVKIVEYNDYINRNLLYFTISAFLISLQTNIPNIILSEFCCSLDFYPSNPDGSRESVKFISTISYHFTKRKDQPWVSLIKSDGSRMKLDELEKEINKAIEKIMDNKDSASLIEQRKQLKLEAISNGLEEKMIEFIPKKYKISNWKQFLPPLVNINIKTHVNDVSEEFKKNLLRKLKMGDITQYDNINILEGKNIIFSLLIQQEIQDVINSEELKLKSLSNQVYLENSCCLALDTKHNFIDYFIQAKPIINTYLVNVNKNSLRLRDIRLMTFSPFLFINKNTQLKYPPISNQFTENTIYMAFINYCNFEKPTPIPDDFKSICKCTDGKPDNHLFDLNDSIHEKVEKLKKIGKNYTNAELIKLLQRVGYHNIIHIHISEVKIIQPLENMRMILPRHIRTVQELPHDKLEDDINKTFISESPLLKSKYLLQFINHWINNVDKKSTVTKEDRDKINDDVSYINNELIKYIYKFLSKKTRLDKKIDDFFKTIFEWKKYPSNFCNLITFIKNYTYNIAKVFPNILANNFLKNGIDSPLFNGIVHKYQGLSDKDLTSIKNETIKYYQRFISLNELINDENQGTIILILNKIQENDFCNLIMDLMNQTPIFSESNKRIFDNETTLSLFSFYYLTIFSTYIEITFEILETVDANPSFKQNIIIILIHLLINYMNMMNEDKITLNISYNDVFDKEFKFKEIEKSEMITRLQQMTNEARKADNNMKAHRLGIWGKGLSDKVFKYTKDYDVIDTTVLNKTKQAEEEMRQVEVIRDILIEQEKEDGDVQDLSNRENIDEDELEHGDEDEDDFNDGYEYDEYDEGEEYNDRDRDE